MNKLASLIESLWDEEENKLEFEEEVFSLRLNEENEEIKVIEDNLALIESHLFKYKDLEGIDLRVVNLLKELTAHFMDSDAWLRIEFNVIPDFNYIGLLLTGYRKVDDDYIFLGEVEDELDIKEHRAEKFTEEIVRVISQRNKELIKQQEIGWI